VKGATLRPPGIVAVALILTVAPPASAQEWTTCTNWLGCLLGFITLEGAAEKMFD
jgi:hypothetical protein